MNPAHKKIDGELLSFFRVVSASAKKKPSPRRERKRLVDPATPTDGRQKPLDLLGERICLKTNGEKSILSIFAAEGAELSHHSSGHYRQTDA